MKSLFHKNKKISVILLCMLVIFTLLAGKAAVGVSAAAKDIIIDDDEYNLYVDEYPDCVSDGIYAKFKTSKSNVDDYYLNLSSDEANEIFSAALVKAKIPVNGMETGAMTASLWQETDDEPKKLSTAVEVLLPLPSDAQEHPDDCKLYMVSGGSAKEVQTELVHDDYDIYYYRFTISSYTTYGFVFPPLDTYEDEEADEETEDEKVEYDDEEEDEEDVDEEQEEPTVTPKPTKAPEPTKKPAEKAEPTKAPEAGKTPADASEEKAPTKAPVKDSIPKTGDDFPMTAITVAAGVSLAAIAVCAALLKKKR